MSDFDDTRRADLSDDDAAFLKSLDAETLEDRGLFAQLGATFHGPMKGWTLFAFFFTFVFFLLFVFGFWRAYEAETVRETVLWCAVALWGSLAVAMLKMWMFDRMNHLATLRELKKVELRVAQLQDGR
ncbi:MAG: hypothetical protein RIC52_10505 [Amphiplicatus sp.]